MIGELDGYPGEVWYSPTGIANILALSYVEKHYRVTYDSKGGNGFTVHKEDGGMKNFIQSIKGLFYLDTKKNVSGTVLGNSVAYNKSRYSNRNYSQAVLAREVQNMIGRPST